MATIALVVTLIIIAFAGGYAVGRAIAEPETFVWPGAALYPPGESLLERVDRLDADLDRIGEILKSLKSFKYS